MCVASFLVLLLVVAAGEAADPSAGYPSRPIEYVSHSKSGAHMVIAQLLSDIIEKEKLLSQPVVCVEKPGSGGAKAQAYLFERKGNPHLVLGVGTTNFICGPLLSKLPFTYKSFTPICNTCVDGSVLVVRSNSPFKTINDLIAEAKKRPKELIQGGSSFTSNEGMMGRTMQQLKGVQWNFLSSKSEGEALLNVLSGDVHFAMLNPAEIIDHVGAGKLRVLLAASPMRYSEFKDTPTMAEAGLGIPLVTYRGIVGPPDMPDYAAKKLEAVFKKAKEHDRFKKYIKDSLMQPFWLSSDEYGKLLGKLGDEYKVILKELNLLKN